MTSLSSLEHVTGADRPLFFLHVPKTAGTTLIQVIEQQFDEREIARWLYPFRLVDTPADFFRRPHYFHGHVDYALMRELLPHKPVTMTVLRQPVERYLSHFGNHKRVSFEQIPDISREVFDALQQTTLADFVWNPSPILGTLAQYFQNLQAKLLASELSTDDLEVRNAQIRANEYVLPTPGLADALARLDQELAFVGLTERFQESLFLMAYTFGWFPATEYKNFNTAQPRPQQGALPADLLQEIGRLNALDQQLYEHGRALFDARYTQMQHELLERYGDREHAHASLPLVPETVAALLDKHYQQRFKDRNPLVSTIKLSFDQKMPGSHWHLPEQHPVHGVVRWTGPGRCAHLDFPLAASTPVWLRFSLALAITPETLASLEIKVNGEMLDVALESADSQAQHYKAYVSKDVLARQPGCVRVSFEVEKTLRPVDVVIAGSEDQRLLGVALSEVAIEPVQEQGGVYQKFKQMVRRLMK